MSKIKRVDVDSLTRLMAVRYSVPSLSKRLNLALSETPGSLYCLASCRLNNIQQPNASRLMADAELVRVVAGLPQIEEHVGLWSPRIAQNER